MNEIWKDIKDYPNYQVSNMGRVRNKKRWLKSSHLIYLNIVLNSLTILSSLKKA